MATGADDTKHAVPASPGAETQSGIRRRELLVGASAAAGAAVVVRFERDQALFEKLLRGSSEQASFTASMLRPEDMLAFDLEFYFASYEVSGEGVPYAYPTPTDGRQRRDFYMVAVFGPQAVAEEPLPVRDPIPTLPVPAQLGGPSRLAFAIRGPLPLDDESLLDWVTLNKQPAPTRAQGGQDPQSKRMLLVPSALTQKERDKLKGRAGPQKPTRTETAIEAPYRMILSPALNGDGEQFWRNRTTPLTNDQRTELWHTRLVNLYCLDNLCSGGDSSLNGEVKPESEIRAVWTPGWNKDASKTENAAPEPFGQPMSLTPTARSEVVSLTSDFKRFNNPPPQKSRLLTLSALGASFDLRFDFPDLKDFNTTHWSDRGTLGREHYVKVVTRGFLFPLGHEASLISISERQIDVKSGNGYAVVRKREYLVLKQKTRRYGSYAFPFSSVTVVDDITPLIDEPSASGVPRLEHKGKGGAFWPRVGGRDFLWTLAATDVEGVRVEFQAPLIFVSNVVATGAAGGKESRTKVGRDRDRILNHYLDNGQTSRRERPFAGQSVAYAKSIPGKARQAAFPTDMYELGAVLTNVGATANGVAAPRFAPEMRSASIKNPALGGLGGSSARVGSRGALNPEALLRVKPAEAYVKDGFNQTKNAAQAYLTAVEKVAIDYTKDGGAAATGALGAPNMELTGLSRTLGPLGGKLTKEGTLPELRPADFLKGAKFLGVEFTDVLPAIIPLPDPEAAAGAYAEQAKKVPRTLTETIYEGGTGQLARKIPKEIRTEFIWEPDLKANAVFIANGPGASPQKATMLLRNVTVVPVSEQGPGEPRQDTTGEIRNFGLALFSKPGGPPPFLIVYFNRFEFRSRNDQKPDVNVDVRDVVFAGPLEFVNDLRKLMSSVGGGAGLTTDITPSGVVASYGVDFPTITTGVITIKDISFGAGIEVPFTGEPVTVRFNFCEPKRPFLLTYTIFGGGGYANVAINSKGVKELTVSLEFGAATAINLGVASGSVQVMAGIVIKVAGEDASLQGFVRLRGELDILGIISVSLEFHLSLGYDTKTKEAWGRATLTVEVEVFCFSKSVSVTAEKRFSSGSAPLRAREGGQKALRGANSPAPISFAELFTPQAWDTYRTAFAPEAF